MICEPPVVGRTRTSQGLLVAGSLFFALTSCKHEVDPRRVVVRDDGVLCLGLSAEVDGGAPTGVDLHADRPLAIGVRSVCLSNACATARSSKCAVKREGDRLVVTSELAWQGPEDLGLPCPSACTALEAQCSTTEALPAGSYRVALGARTVDLALPSHRGVRCESDKPPEGVVAAAPAARDPAPPPAVTATLATPVDANAVPSAPGTGVVVESPPGDTICIGPAGTAAKTRALKAGQPVAVTVLHRNACLGASCTRAPARCTAKRKGFNIVVSAQFPTSVTKPTQPCTEDCSAIAATCLTDGLRAGSYTVEIGPQRKTLQIPAASPPPCGP